MRRCAVAWLVAAMLSGCVNYRASRITATTGATMAWVGVGVLVLGAVAAETTDTPSGGVLGLFVLGAGISVPGVILWLSGRGFMALHESPAEKREREARELDRYADPECLQRRSAQWKRAQDIVDREARAKALLAIPVCEPVLLQSSERVQPAPPPPGPPLPYAGTKSEAVELHERALAAGRTGDCTTVQMIAKRVEQLDREYYDADFVISPAIKACLPVAR